MLESVTTTPFAGATELIVTVPVLGLPGATEVGLSFNDVKVGDVIVKVADWVTPFKLTEIDAVVCEETAMVFTANVAVDLPDGTVTEAKTVADFELLINFTTTPLVGAGPLRETVPVEETPPATVVGLRLTDCRVGGSTVRVAVFETVPPIAVIAATFGAETPVVINANVASL